MLWAKAINYIQAFNPLIIHGVSVVLVPTEVTRHPCSLESLSIDSIYFSFPENLTGDQCETHFWVSGSEVKQEDIRSQTEFDWQRLKNTLSLYCESTENGSYIGIVHPKMKMRWTCTHSQAIQDVDNKLIYILDGLRVGTCLMAFWWHPFTAEDPLLSKWMGAIRIRVQTADKTSQ